MKLIIFHPTANANVRAIVNKLAEENNLYKFYTSIAVFPSNYLINLTFFIFLEFQGLQTIQLLIYYHLSSGSGGMADALDSGSSGSFILWEFKSPLPH